ncbi:hypothetical protein GCM10007079_32530 [Nocardiopsis terrae]|nr:hypothetical protein GCM10007079_32530 [Nocardiopsis terrae]
MAKPLCWRICTKNVPTIAAIPNRWAVRRHNRMTSSMATGSVRLVAGPGTAAGAFRVLWARRGAACFPPSTFRQAEA